MENIKVSENQNQKELTSEEIRKLFLIVQNEIINIKKKHEFTKASKVNPGNCEHFDINFLYSAESNSMKFCPSLTCRNCKKNNIIELINEKTKNEIGSINYKCPQCGMGNITIGYLFQNEEINLDPLPNNAQQNNQIFNIGQNKKKISSNDRYA